jgi:hypothetical protein
MAKGKSSKTKGSSSSKTKIFVKNSKSKSNAKPVEIKPLPNHWPVASTQTPLEVSQLLKPGNILHKCNGRDIKLSKNSDSKPNLATGRGRFLFVLPGSLSLKKPFEKGEEGSKHDNPDSNNLDTDVCTGMDVDTPQHDAKMATAVKSSYQPPGSSPAAVKPASSTSTLFTMGKVRHLETDHPKLEIELPTGQLLVFRGTKVSTTSRYLVLSCKTSGVVNCRNVFQEMVIFGDHSVQGHVDEDEVKEQQQQQTEINIEEGDQEQVFHHYGGSERALDGGREVRGVKRPRASSGIAGKGSMDSSCVETDLISQESTIISQESATGKKDVEDVDSDNEGKGNNGVIELDSDGTDAEEFKTDSPAPPPRARSSRRSASKPIQYSFTANDSDDSEQESENDSGSNSDKEIPFATRAKLSRTRLSKQIYNSDSEENDSGSNNGKETPLLRARLARGSLSKQLKNSYLKENDSESLSHDSGSDGGEAPPARAKSIRRSSSKQVKYNVDDSDSNSSANNEELEDDSDEEIDSELPKKAKPTRKPISRAKNDVIDLTSKKAEKPAAKIEKITAKTGGKGKMPTGEKKLSAKKRKASVVNLEEAKSADAAKPDSKKKTALSTISPSLRKRRKSTSPKKPSSTSKILDINMEGDDEFIFIE